MQFSVISAYLYYNINAKPIKAVMIAPRHRATCKIKSTLSQKFKVFLLFC